MRLSAIPFFAPKGRRELRHRSAIGAKRTGGAKSSGRSYIVSTARRQAVRRGTLSILCLGLIGSAWWAHSTGKIDTAVTMAGDIGADLSRASGFVVRDVLVDGRKRLGQADILAALDIEQGMPILAFSPEQAQARLTKLGWVKSATVTRTFPDTIFVTLTERLPLAIWQLDGKLTLISADGSVITEEALDGFSNLLQVVGPGAEHHAAELIAALRVHPEIEPIITSAIWVSDRRWDLILEQGTKVRLPAGAIGDALVHLVEMQRDYTVLGQEIVSIDLRLPDRLVVRLPSETEAAEAANGNSTNGGLSPDTTQITGE